MTPRTGTLSRSSMSATSRRLVSKYSSVSATPTPSMRPKTIEATLLRRKLGRLGRRAGSAVFRISIVRFGTWKSISRWRRVSRSVV